KEGRRIPAFTFGGAAAVYLALALFGGQWSATRSVEPLRFVVPLHVLLSVPAGSALARGWSRLGPGRRGGVWGLGPGTARMGGFPVRAHGERAPGPTLHQRASHGAAPAGCRHSPRDESPG